jgi:3-hydroxyisobutyrate dehydrogenase-like beta-hydroxyacid dehydrogenase
VVTVGLLHPGEMGAAVGAALRAAGRRVLWASQGRSEATVARAGAAGLEDAGTVEELCRGCEVVLSICPPHAAVEVARQAIGCAGIYVDANAVSPATARTIAGLQPRFVDGGIIGPPPREAGKTRLYLSGEEAERIAELFAGTPVDARVVGPEPGAASAVKMAYASWTKGSAALLLTARELARAEGVEATLLQEWRVSIPELDAELASAARSAQAKGWRWVGEMQEIASSMAADGLPAGFHEAAAEVYRRAAGTGGS